jgi:hypothetical protein
MISSNKKLLLLGISLSAAGGLVLLISLLALSAFLLEKGTTETVRTENQSLETENPPAEGREFDFQTLEFAQTRDELNQGLMHREELCEECGMLFIFEKQEVLSFWMKNTLVSLDIIFINENGEVVKIHRHTKTNQTQETYSSEKPARYVLEVNAGWSEAKNLQEGDKIDIDHLLEQRE